MAIVPPTTTVNNSEIVFFDLETTVPRETGQRFWVLEFGAIVVCSKNLSELDSYTTLIKPDDLSVVAVKSGRAEGITREAVREAPTFEEVSDRIFNILEGRIWAGHNIRRFDCVRLKEAFADVGRPAPVPAGIIDSLGVLTDKFGRRAGNMKMATLAAYFGLGQQKHRSLDDVRMNLEVLKHCATVLFLESSLPNHTFNRNIQASCSTIMTRSRANPMNRSLTNDTLAMGSHEGEISPTLGYKKVITRSRSNGKFPTANCREEISKSKKTTYSSYHRTNLPYARVNLGQVTENVTRLLRTAQSRTLGNLLMRHSHSLLR
ncbi:protein NEN4 [Impatiens glandulifera]|uniref:protein NEN4 n=1 Tax=Impatiens glandulifera TaxID=253017 RepID=UPI001FB157C6|nr:protein NEN4 [Impatiens glandulifera]